MQKGHFRQNDKLGFRCWTVFFLIDNHFGDAEEHFRQDDKLRFRCWTVFFLIDNHFGDAEDAFSPK
ncbi:hypothetical protein [Psychroflexus planctonicus]|uniref:Uncharacterized protein n=1 Tax=Psychroflexus planctonicus TaxID=1526575 RepID=A0ABQ1SHN0_9FLAO|nr:hypothetical protein [Psychroflexus planctonicus]GGE36570.1 hypothetical protein GCM10010832_15950 [Psychroflexus planctonicus]